jgi:hypothetical protein
MTEVQVISGGADTLAERYSREVLGKEPLILAADWKQFRNSVGPKRDNEIVKVADLVIAFPGKGRALGTRFILPGRKESRSTSYQSSDPRIAKLERWLRGVDIRGYAEKSAR